ncbi:AfsR/SARP family transcriptional regulator [Streptomyces salinarius]|uniref:AfsR/SARP family transcriptional regulator n=1 Tax=Streptomyces salinarius TaxID=2762598 RepID=UPI0013D9FAE6|nr:BTAD domain-containing putative transcriptional regulator [Streptomyces salinarius]
MHTFLDASLLGSIAASRDGCPIELGSPTQRTVFAVLATHANRVVSRDELVNAVWGAHASPTAVNSVYTYVARLRKLLEPDRPRSAEAEVLHSDRLGYTLRVSPGAVDAQRFSAALAEARLLRAQNATESAVAKLEAGLALWRGTPYTGAIGAFVEAERVRLSEARLSATDDYAEMLLELNSPERLVGELVSLVAHYPMRERLNYLLMRCYVELGQHADAIGAYHTLRRRLAEEQGIEPGAKLRELYEQVLHSDQLRIRPRATRAATAPAPPAGRVPTDRGHRAPAAAQLLRPAAGFTGRATELRELTERAVAAADSGEPSLLLITGGPGVGKTALATQLAHLLAPRYPDGQLQIDLRAFSDAGAPRTSASVLREVAAALGAAPPARGADPEAAYRSMLSGRRLLIVLDDAASAEQVRALLPGTPCLVIVTSRYGLAGLIARDGARRTVLQGLDEADAVQLFGRMTGQEFVAQHRAVVQRLATACEGLPLALRLAATRILITPFPDAAVGQFDVGSLIDSLDLPVDPEASLTAAYDRSYARLPVEAAHVYRSLGRHFAPESTLLQATALSGYEVRECRRQLDVLADAGLLTEVAPGIFRMHALVHAHARLRAARRSASGRDAVHAQEYVSRFRPCLPILPADKEDDGPLDADPITGWCHTSG